MRNVYVGTDFHLYSAEFDKRHPFRTKQSIGQFMENYGNEIEEDDLFIFLGDLCDPCAADINDLKIIISAIPGYKIMCRGNHDTQDDDFYKEIGFDQVCEICKIHNLVFSHKPIRVAPDELNIHGHLHTEKLSTSGYQHINAYGVNHDMVDKPILVDDLIDAAAVQDKDSVRSVYWDDKNDALFEKYVSLENDTYTNIIDLTDMITIAPLDETTDILSEILFQDVESTEYWLQDDEYEPGKKKKEPMADGEGTLDEVSLTEAASFNNVMRIVNNIPKEEHHYFYHGPSFKNSPHVKYRDIAYVPNTRNKAGAFIEIYAFDNEPDIGIVVMAAEPAARGQGLTNKLLQKAIREVPKLGITKLVARIDIDNTHSYNMAIRNGFTDVSNKKVNLDQYELVLELGPKQQYATFRLEDYYINIKKLKPLWYSAVNQESGNPCIIFTDKKLGDDARWGYVEIENGEIYGLNVNEKYQNQGIATQLIKYAIALYNASTLRVYPDNKNAISLYTKLGFVPTGEIGNDGLFRMRLSGTIDESSYNYKDLSDVKPIDREEKERIAEKYDLVDPDKVDVSNKTDKPDTPEDRVEKLRKQRDDNLKKARVVKKRKHFARKIKSHLPGVKNGSLQSYVEGTEVDDSDLAHYDTDGIDNDPLYGTRRHFFPELGYPKEESVTINEGGLKYLISNGVQDLTFALTRPDTNMLYTGNYDPIKPHLLKMADNANTTERLIYLRNDAHLAINFLTKLAKNMEDYQHGTQSRYISATDMEKRFKKGNTPQKTRAYVSWIKTEYIPHINKRIKELRTSIRECIEGYKFNIQDKSFRFLDRMNESAEDDGKLYPVYILLMHSGTALSTAIKAVTQSNFSHSSISFDSSMHNMYSFGRKADVNPFVGGFKKEDIRNPFFQNREIPYALYMVPCTKGEITMMKKRLDFFIKNSTKFHYDFTGLFKNYLGIADNPEYKWFCSRFVADILNAGRPSDDPYITEPSLMKPEDFRFTNFAQYVSGGFMTTYDSKLVDKITTRLLRIEKLKRKKQSIMDKEMSIIEAGYDIDYLNPYAETVLNYQLTVIDESAVDSFFTYLKSFKLRFDKEGNIIITRREYDQLDSHFKSSQKMIKACEKAGNIEGVKEELSKIYYMIHLINDQYLSNKTAPKSDVVKKDMIDLRSVMMNVFQQHLTYVTKLDPKFNFQSYYDGSKYGKDTTIPKATISSIGKTIVTLLS